MTKSTCSFLETYQRLLSIACTQGPPDPSVFAHELAAVAPALFHDDGSMRKTQKSKIASHIVKLSPDILTTHAIENTRAFVYDGMYMLHIMSWPKAGTIPALREMFTDFLAYDLNPHDQAALVLDDYEHVTTKAPEQKRRKLSQKLCPVIRLDLRTPIPSDKEAFLANTQNKQSLINILGRYVTEKLNMNVIHAKQEGDADPILVSKALEFAK